MPDFRHFKALEDMYAAAPINDFFKPSMIVSEGIAEIEIDLTEKFYHSAGAVHGSVYFKILDDAAFFAANSYEKKFFVLTASFTTQLTKPVSMGKMKAIGKIVSQNKTRFIAESTVYNSEGEEIGYGEGVFVCSQLPLHQAAGYDKK